MELRTRVGALRDRHELILDVIRRNGLAERAAIVASSKSDAGEAVQFMVGGRVLGLTLKRMPSASPEAYYYNVSGATPPISGTGFPRTEGRAAFASAAR